MTEPRWLNQAEMRAWLGYRRMRTLLDATIDRDLLTGAGLSEQDYDVLSNLTALPDHRARISDLADRLRWSRSRLSHHLKRMETRGLITRKSSPQDARSAIVVLTATGLNAIKTSAPGHVASVREHLIDVLTPQQIQTLGDIAESVLGRLAERDLRWHNEST